MALIRARSLNGFVKNSTAPAFMARTVIGTLPYPVMKMIGMVARLPSRLCSSETVEARKADVEYQASRSHGMFARQKLFR